MDIVAAHRTMVEKIGHRHTSVVTVSAGSSLQRIVHCCAHVEIVEGCKQVDNLHWKKDRGAWSHHRVLPWAAEASKVRKIPLGPKPRNEVVVPY